MQPKIPDFKSPFLKELTLAFYKRRKAISNKVMDLEFEYNLEPSNEWLRIFFSDSLLYVNLYAYSGNILDFYITSAQRKDRGKIIFRLEFHKVPRNGKKIIKIIENCISLICNIKDEKNNINNEVLIEIKAEWDSIKIDVI